MIAFGEFEEITDADEGGEILKNLLNDFSKFTPAEAVRRDTEASGEIVLFRVNVRRITGRAES